MLTSALKNSFTSLFTAAATGGEFVADRPALFLAGEAGPERVSVTPNQPDMGPKGGGGGGPVNMTLHFHGDGSGFDPRQIKRLVKQAYFEIATEGPGIRRLTTNQVRRSL